MTSSPISPIRPIGLAVNLTCTVMVYLNPLMNVPVMYTVNTNISGPPGTTITPLTNSVMENITRYTSTAMINSFGRDQSGEYTCTATVEVVAANSIIRGNRATGNITVGTGK